MSAKSSFKKPIALTSDEDAESKENRFRKQIEKALRSLDVRVRVAKLKNLRAKNPHHMFLNTCLLQELLVAKDIPGCIRLLAEVKLNVYALPLYIIKIVFIGAASDVKMKASLESLFPRMLYEMLDDEFGRKAPGSGAHRGKTAGVSPEWH